VAAASRKKFDEGGNGGGLVVYMPNGVDGVKMPAGSYQKTICFRFVGLALFFPMAMQPNISTIKRILLVIGSIVEGLK
jgi:hypothetical protein